MESRDGSVKNKLSTVMMYDTDTVAIQDIYIYTRCREMSSPMGWFGLCTEEKMGSDFAFQIRPGHSNGSSAPRATTAKA